jgi:hypothetical protein
VLYKMSTHEAFIECKTGRAELKDVEARTVDALVHFLYFQKYEYDEKTWNAVVLEQQADFTRKRRPGAVIDLSDKIKVARWEKDVKEARLEDSRARLEKIEDRLDFHLGVCILAECYNMKALKLAAEEHIEKEHLYPRKAHDYETLSATVDKILDSDAPESLRNKVFESLAHQTELLDHEDNFETGSTTLLNRRPELAVAVLKSIAKKRHANLVREKKGLGQ